MDALAAGGVPALTATTATKEPREVPWRVLTCRRCKTPVVVYEPQGPWIDPREFTGSCCLREKRSAT